MDVPPGDGVPRGCRTDGLPGGGLPRCGDGGPGARVGIEVR